jgi:hypothetical protein
MRSRLILMLVAGVVLGACNRSESVHPDTPPPGAGAGQRGGLNDGDAAGKVRSTPATGQDNASPVQKNSGQQK